MRRTGLDPDGILNVGLRDLKVVTPVENVGRAKAGRDRAWSWQGRR